jgi:hypothetical protein
MVPTPDFVILGLVDILTGFADKLFSVDPVAHKK